MSTKVPSLGNLQDFALQVLAEFYGCPRQIEQISREIYKNTQCGACARFTEYELMVGTIVEGSDEALWHKLDLRALARMDQPAQQLLLAWLRHVLEECEVFVDQVCAEREQNEQEEQVAETLKAEAAAVKDDSDEVITEDWLLTAFGPPLASCDWRRYSIHVATCVGTRVLGWCPPVHGVGSVSPALLCLDEQVLLENPTRGELRMLLKALRIKRPENERVTEAPEPPPDLLAGVKKDLAAAESYARYGSPREACEALAAAVRWLVPVVEELVKHTNQQETN